MTGTWKKIKFSKQALRPPSRAYHSSLSVTNEDKHFLFIFGGKSKDRNFNDVWYYRPQTKEWNLLQTKGAIPPLRYYSQMTRIQNKIIIFGGKNYELKMQGLIFNPFFPFLVQILIMKYKGNFPVATKSYLNDIYLLDLTNSVWHNVSHYGYTVPSPRCLHRFIAFKQYIYLISGGFLKFLNDKNNLFS